MSEKESQIPESLAARDQWVAWMWARRDDGKWTKVPYHGNEHYSQKASSTDPGTWMGYGDARRFAEANGLPGIGYVFTADDPYAGIDLDGCRDPETGEIAPWARGIIEHAGSYAEVSPSGTGVKIIVEGALPRAVKTGRVEMYDRGRFFTLTGERVDGTPVEVRPAQATLDGLYAQHAKERGEAAPGASGPGNGLSDGEVIQNALASRTGDRLRALYLDGDTSGYASKSEADMALAGMLAFWTGGDREQMDRLFRRSALMRPKWDERHYGDGRTYGEGKIDAAISGRDDYYRPARESAGLRGRRLIGRAIAEGVKPPETLEDHLLYAAKIMLIFGEAECGKTILALWFALQRIKRGRPVLYLDEEGSQEMIAERLEAMGADPASLDAHLYYFQGPGVTLTDESIADLMHTVEEIKPALVVFDSWADFLALAGLNEYDSVDVTRWVKRVAYPIRDAGAAVLILDHVNKDGSGKGSRGSTAKRAKMDAAYKVIKKADFDREHEGKLLLVRDKDRLGALKPLVGFTVGGDGSGRLICARDDAALFDPTDNLTPSERTALDALKGFGATGATFTEWKGRAGLTPSTFNLARTGLLRKLIVHKQDNRWCCSGTSGAEEVQMDPLYMHKAGTSCPPPHRGGHDVPVDFDNQAA